MCLDRVLQTFDPPKSVPENWLARLFKLNRGYKVVRLGAEKWQPLFRDGEYPYNTWLVSNNETLFRSQFARFIDNDFAQQEYKSGFHFLKTKKEAYRYAMRKSLLGDNIVIVPILYKNVVAFGIQNDVYCIVAKEIFVECPT